MSRSRKSKTSKTTSSAAGDSQSPQLARSCLHEEINSLKQDQQWLFKQIKRKRTELKNLVDQLQDISREMFQRCNPVFQEMSERDREIHRLFSEVLTKRKLGKKSQKKVQKLYESLQMDGVISPDFEEDQQEADSFWEEFGHDCSEHKTHQQQYQQQEQTEVGQPTAGKAPNQGNIRETFLRLASRFHPDKVTDSETQTQYTAIMQEVNEAYQKGDFAKLLEIERQQHNEEIVASNDNKSSLETQRSQLLHENDVLRQQYEEIKQELRYLRRTPEGTIVTDYRRATKEGIDPIAEMVDQAQTQLEVLTEIRDFVRDFRDKKMTVEQFLAGPELRSDLTLDESFLEDMFE